MSKFYIKLGIALSSLVALTASTASLAGGISFFVGFPQPIAQETYAPVMMRPVYMPREHKRCYIERPVYINGMLYSGQRICERNLVSTQAVWIPDNGLDYYRYHRHHVSYKHYY